mmetsp:Transcript_46635/g.122461  ORF Transcript_46635/g.122461 Transcript_46635/m.122461 type:complete len:224 (+) Transcript_46635:252-923(+)
MLPDPSMVQDLVCAQSLAWLGFEERLHQCTRTCRDRCIERRMRDGTDAGLELLERGTVKGGLSMQCFEKHDAEGPHVHWPAAVTPFLARARQLGSDVRRCANELAQHHLAAAFGRETKVAELNAHVGCVGAAGIIEEDVPRLDVAMDEVEQVHVLKGACSLPCQPRHLCLRHSNTFTRRACGAMRGSTPSGRLLLLKQLQVALQRPSRAVFEHSVRRVRPLML